MARLRPIQTNMTAGELSPKLAGQVNLDKYKNGAETVENYTIFKQGGATRAPGTRFVKEVKDSTAKTILVPFEFNITQAYILEFGNLYIRQTFHILKFPCGVRIRNCFNIKNQQIHFVTFTGFRLLH